MMKSIWDLFGRVWERNQIPCEGFSASLTVLSQKWSSASPSTSESHQVKRILHLWEPVHSLTTVKVVNYLE